MCKWGSYNLRSPRAKYIYTQMTLPLKKQTEKQSTAVSTVSSIITIVGRAASGWESDVLSMVTWSNIVVAVVETGIKVEICMWAGQILQFLPMGYLKTQPTR